MKANITLSHSEATTLCSEKLTSELGFEGDVNVTIEGKPFADGRIQAIKLLRDAVTKRSGFIDHGTREQAPSGYYVSLCAAKDLIDEILSVLR
jgi:hypothetical protein